MAKDGKMSLPSVDNPSPQPPTEQLAETKKLAEQQIMESHGIPADVLGYIPRNVDVRMSRAQARILRDKLRALQDAGAKTADGRFVDNRAQAVRWIIENEVVL